MKIWMQIIALVALVMSFATAAQAQVSAWGSGQWGGNQACPYQQKAGDGAESEQDILKEKQDAINEAQKQLKAKQADLKTVKKDLKTSRDAVEKGITEEFSSFLFEHIEMNRSCGQYKGMPASSSPESSEATGSRGGETLNALNSAGASASAGGEANLTEIQEFQLKEWEIICDSSKRGSVKSVVCEGSRFRQADSKGGTIKDCQRGLGDYRKSYVKSTKLESDIENAKRDIAAAKKELQSTKQQLAEERRERQKEQLEGGICADCAISGSGYAYRKPQTDWGNVISNVGTGLLATYMGYKSQQMVTEANASIGWPTQSYPAVLGGMPYFQAGLYGALGGGVGTGGFGCGGSMNGGNSVFNNGMNGMFNPMTGGGMYMPGMSPWGMAGPNMMYPNGMYPGGGYMASGGIMMPNGMMMGNMASGAYMMPSAMMMNNMMPGSMASGAFMMPSAMMMGNMASGAYMMPSAMMMSNMMSGSMASAAFMMPNAMMMGNGYMATSMMPGTALMASSMMPGSGLMVNNAWMMSNGMMTSGVDSMQIYTNYMNTQMEKQKAALNIQTEMAGLAARLMQLQYSTTGNYLGVSGGTTTGSSVTGPGVPLNGYYGTATSTIYPGTTYPGTTNLPASR